MNESAAVCRAFACSMIPIYWSFTHNLSVSLSLSRMFSVSCLLPCFPNSICSNIYMKKINFEGFQELLIDLIK